MIEYFLLAVLCGKCLVGFTVNMMMVAANLIKWKSLKSLQTCDKILSSLAISRILFFSNVFLNNFIVEFFPWLLNKKTVIPTIYIQTMFTFYSSFWIATVLCVFYCVKIVTYNYKLFIFLRSRILTMVPWLIPASLLISLLSSLPFAWYGYDINLQNISNGSSGNMTEYMVVIVPNFNIQLLLFAVGSVPPFLIFCVAISLLMHFLLVHTRRMRSNESHAQSPNLKSHFGAMKSMSIFLLLQIMSFICMNFFISGKFFQFKFLVFLCWILLGSPPLVHSLYMVSSSSEVRKMFTSMSLGFIR